MKPTAGQACHCPSCLKSFRKQDWCDNRLTNIDSGGHKLGVSTGKPLWSRRPGPRQWVDEGSSNPAGKGGISPLQESSTEDAMCSSGAFEKSPTSLSQGYQQPSLLTGPAYPSPPGIILPALLLPLPWFPGRVERTQAASLLSSLQLPCQAFPCAHKSGPNASGQ